MSGFEALWTLIQQGEALLIGATGSGIASWFLVLIFAFSGLPKVRRPALAALAMMNFGLFQRVLPFFGRMLGVSEMGLALALALDASHVLDIWFAVVAAAVLLWSFTFLIARSLLADAKFACFCFGEVDDQISAWTLARTLALALLASGLAMGRGSTSGITSVQPILVQGLIALSLFGTLALVLQVPVLLRWNRGLFARHRMVQT